MPDQTKLHLAPLWPVFAVYFGSHTVCALPAWTLFPLQIALLVAALLVAGSLAQNSPIRSGEYVLGQTEERAVHGLSSMFYMYFGAFHCRSCWLQAALLCANRWCPKEGGQRVTYFRSASDRLFRGVGIMT